MDEEYPAPRWGHPKDRRPDLKQIQTGLAVSGDGGIPVFHHAYEGGAAEVAQVVGAMTALRQIAGPRAFLLVGDSKLISYTNAAAMKARQVGFIAPLAAARVPAGLFAALPPGAGTPVDYIAGRDAGKPAAARGVYRVLEDGGMDLAGPRKADPPVHLRRILVYSSANATGAAKARARKLAKATADLDRLVRTAGTRFHPTADAVAARVTAIATQRRVKAYLRTTISRGPTGKPALSWHFDQAALGAEAATDGWYALLTNLEPSQAGAAEVFRRYKGQHIVERRYGEFKGPLAVAPLFLKTNRRIAALITVICLALLIFCLIERQVRKALAPHGGTMTGLPGYQATAARPTGRTIFQALADLRLIPAHPLFLKTSRRISALITVICLALLIFCLIERQVRNALAPHGGLLTGLPGYGPTPARPTGKTIFEALGDLRLIPAHDGNPAVIPKPAGIQARLLDLHKIDISRPRWLTQ